MIKNKLVKYNIFWRIVYLYYGSVFRGICDVRD